jgi:hypothetical protein
MDQRKNVPEFIKAPTRTDAGCQWVGKKKPTQIS